MEIEDACSSLVQIYCAKSLLCKVTPVQSHSCVKSLPCKVTPVILHGVVSPEGGGCGVDLLARRLLFALDQHLSSGNEHSSFQNLPKNS